MTGQIQKEYQALMARNKPNNSNGKPYNNGHNGTLELPIDELIEVGIPMKYFPKMDTQKTSD